jgi:hypothetical protein
MWEKTNKEPKLFEVPSDCCSEVLREHPRNYQDYFYLYFAVLGMEGGPHVG